MLHQAGVEQGLSAEQGHGVAERGEELVHLPCGLWGAPGRLELVGCGGEARCLKAGLLSL